MTTPGGIAAEQLRSLILRIERLEAEIADLNGDKSAIYKDAKGQGFDVKVMRALVAERRKDPDALAEHSDLLDCYRRALECGEATPSRARAQARVHVHEGHDPETGEVGDVERAIKALGEPKGSDLPAKGSEFAGKGSDLAPIQEPDLAIPSFLDRRRTA